MPCAGTGPSACWNTPALSMSVFMLQEMLLEQLAQLISAAISQAGADRGDTIRYVKQN